MTAARNFPTGLKEQLLDKTPVYALGALMLAVQQYLMARRDFFVRDAVDAATEARALDARTAAIGIFAVSILAAGARIASRVAVFTAGRNVEYELRAVLLDKLQRLGPAFFRTMPTGDIMSRATNDLGQVRLLVGFGVLNVMSSLFALTSALYVMLHISVRLTLASFVTLPLLWLTTRAFSIRIFRRTQENQEAIGKMSDRVLASLAGIRVVRSFGLAGAELRDFERYNDVYLDKGLALAYLRGSMGPVMGAISAVGVLVVFWYGGVLLETKVISPGDFVSFWLALLRLTWPLLALGFVAAIVQRGRAGYERVKQIYDAESDIQSGDKNPEQAVRGELVVKNLSFAYHDNQPVVHNVSFTVPAGSSLALVGRTGSGKSTVASLLPRLMPTPRGSVFLDGDDVCDLPLERVRGSIGYAQQDAFLFSTTVARNIAYSVDSTDDELEQAAVRRAAEEAAVLDDIERLPEAFDTVVGERGVQLSGGQRQRVALARALLRDAPILVLDDPLSAVDAKTEAAILDAIDKETSRRTVILITHRVAAAKRMDQVVVLEDGHVLESGTHDELLAKGGPYADIAREQEIQEALASLGAEP